MNKKKIVIEKFIMCDCYGHSMLLHYDGTEGFRELDVSFWSRGHWGEVMSFRERLRWTWKILRTGNPWADSVCLNPKKINELADYMIKLKEIVNKQIEEDKIKVEKK
jgi:hypothetical protein